MLEKRLPRAGPAVKQHRVGSIVISSILGLRKYVIYKSRIFLAEHVAIFSRTQPQLTNTVVHTLQVSIYCLSILEQYRIQVWPGSAAVLQ